MRRFRLAVLAGAVLPASLVRAQDAGDFAAYAALVSTPVAGLPAVARSVMFTADEEPTQFTARFGTIDGDQHFGIGGDWSVGGAGRFAATLGYSRPGGCSGCPGNIMFGIDAIGRLARRTIGDAARNTMLSVSVSPAVGLTRSLETDVDGLLIAASLGAPVALAFRASENSRGSLFLTPAIGFGRASGGGQSLSGMRPMLGGGAGVEMNRVTVTVSAQKVFIDDGEMQFGIGLAVRRR